MQRDSQAWPAPGDDLRVAAAQACLDAAGEGSPGENPAAESLDEAAAAADEAALARDDEPAARAKKPSRRRVLAAKKAARTRAENNRLDAMWKHERELWRAGCQAIAGVDESGVGPLAGPVVAAAAILPGDFKVRGFWECKRLLRDKRPHFYGIIMDRAIAVAVGIVEVDEIDRINIHQAALKAMRLALSGLQTRPDSALVDGFSIPGLDIFQRPVVDGDVYSMSIAAASVIAKVTRDRIMERLDRLYPGYGFASHKGYGTRAHYRALVTLGPCEAHRRSFGPVMRALQPQVSAEDAESLADAAVDLADACADVVGDL